MTRRCAHPLCRTSLDEHPVECPHSLPFCDGCTWEEACQFCAMDADNQRRWDAAADARPAPMTRSEELLGLKAEQRKDERAWDWAEAELRASGGAA